MVKYHEGYKPSYKHFIRVITILGERELTVTQLTDGIGNSWSAIYPVIQYMENNGLIETNKIGRRRKVKLTEKGHKLYKPAMQIYIILK